MCIYIPAYNAEKTIQRVLERIPRHVLGDSTKVLVVDNASTDRTARVVEEYRSRNSEIDLAIITNDGNAGYGGSQKIAYRYAVDHGFDVVAMLHADGQYAPEMLDRLIDPVVKGESDLVFGSRIAGNPLAGGMPVIRYLGNRALTMVQNLFLGMSLSEYHSGYRVYSVGALASVPFERLASDYHFDTEILVVFRHFEKRIREVAIPTHYGDEENYVNIWKYGLDVLVTTISYWLDQRRIRRSRNWTYILSAKGWPER